MQNSGLHIVLTACDRGLVRLSEELMAIVAEEREALDHPIEEFERRIVAMKSNIAEAERSMHEHRFLLMAERQRLSNTLVDRRQTFLRSILATASQGFHTEENRCSKTR